MSELKCIGLMSGTSMDGIDAALIVTDGKFRIRQIMTSSLVYEQEFQILLKSAEYSVKKNKGNLSLAEKNYPIDSTEFFMNISQDNKPLALYLYGKEVHVISLQDIINHSTLLHAKLVIELLKKANMKPEEIDLVGYHGQALYHRPADGISIQVGNPQLLANQINITVINDFRTNDIKNGGQGAPLAPIYHQALSVRDNNYPIGILNCGGIANVTVITGISDNDIIGFDTGPGNVLIDQYIRIHTGESMDKDGKYGTKGEVNKKLFTILAEKAIAKDKINYLNVRPPKSLDAGDFKLIPELDQLKFEDACATLEAFTAYTIVESLKLIDVKLPKKWVLAGGGWNNPIITSKLREYFNEQIGSDVEIVKADQIGWDSKYIEAELFAYLAARSLYKLPISYPKTTNVRSVTFGGHAYLPENKNLTQAVEYLLKINPSVLSGYKRN